MTLDEFLTKNYATKEDVIDLCEIDELTFQKWKENGVPHPFDKLIAIACGGDLSHIRGWQGWRLLPHKLETPAGWLVYSDEIEIWTAKYGTDKNTNNPREQIKRRDKFRRIHERAGFIRTKTRR